MGLRATDTNNRTLRLTGLIVATGSRAGSPICVAIIAGISQASAILNAAVMPLERTRQAMVELLGAVAVVAEASGGLTVKPSGASFPTTYWARIATMMHRCAVSLRGDT